MPEWHFGTSLFSGLMRRLLLFVVGLVLLALGAQGIYHAFSNSRRTEMSCDAFARGRPNALWLRLTDCELDYLGAGYNESRGRISELLFPVRAADVPDQSRRLWSRPRGIRRCSHSPRTPLADRGSPTRNRTLVMM